MLLNRIKFNGYEQQSKEFSDDSGLEWYDYKHRFYDNQIGRFFTQDALADTFPIYSPYQFAGNEVPNAIDLDGHEPLRQHVINAWNGTKSWWNDFNAGRGKTYAAVDWFNRNINPVGMIVHGGYQTATGKDLLTQEEVSRVQGVANFSTGVLTLFTAGYFRVGTAGMVTTSTAAAESSVWSLNWSARGFRIGELLGENLPRNFPTIDKWMNGTATSIKSLDLTAASYSKGNTLLNTVKGYINDVAGFNGANWGGVRIAGNEIKTRALELAVQPGKATIQQWEAIGEAIKYAKSKGIEFTLQFIK